MKISFQKISLFALLLISTSVLAQGTLRGVVTDTLDNSPLVGANVYLIGTALGSASNLEGEYRIDRVPAGAYTLRISYIGYSTKQIKVTIQNNKTIAVNAALTQHLIEAGSIVVTGQAIGQAAAINQQITANTIVNVVSEEKIQELPDANAAESIGRLPGVSLQRSGGEANKIVLRGLSDKFSSITVDGVRIAPTDVNSRGVDLSTISQGSLAGIELYKALTPDRDADAIAGSVNLVTKKAPAERLLRLDAKGSYNKLGKEYEQYDFVARYGQRYFNDGLGVQLSGNLEQRDRSKENINLDYNLRSLTSGGDDYEITDFTLNFTDELRKRGGASLLLDVNTPDGGSIRFNNIYNRTKRNFIEYQRNYPNGSDEVFYSARDREQEIYTFNSFVKGENHLLGLSADWGLSLAKSNSKFPFDYEADFFEPSSTQGNVVLSGMRPYPGRFKGPPEDIVPYAVNNFSGAYFYSAYFRGEKNNDNEKTAYLNLKRDYTLGASFSGELKIGGKYRDKSRDRSLSELLSPHYNEAFAGFVRASDGSIVAKNLSGTPFANLATVNGRVLLTNFLDATPADRNLYGKYRLNPLLNRDALRLWWNLNRNGFRELEGRTPEYRRNLEPDATFYDIAERVSAGYLMNTFNIGQNLTFIAGVRFEHENNDYVSRYALGTLGGFPVPSGSIRDTAATHQETVWLPNAHLTFRPTGFMNVRLAAYRALARPDFNHRLASIVSKSAGTFYPGNSIYIGNTGLRAAKAWNYEINTSFFGNKIGLFSVSAFYKDVKDMYHILNGLPFTGKSPLDSLGINYIDPFNGVPYALTYPFNSSQPTRVWGFEVEHQTNLGFLPGLLKNFVLSYNLSIVRSETYIPTSKTATIDVIVPGIPFPIKKIVYSVEQKKQKLEGQPEFFGNFAMGYDLRGFSARLSVFHQSEYNRTFSPDGKSDTVVDSFTRWDFVLKQEIFKNASVLLNVNNFTNVEEGTSSLNRVQGWHLLNTSEVYGLTGDLGLRLSF